MKIPQKRNPGPRATTLSPEVGGPGLFQAVGGDWGTASGAPSLWATVTAISVETPPEVLRAARGRSVTLPCTYRTSVLERKGFIQWDKLLRSHSEKVLAWTFSTKDYVYGKLYENRVTLSGNAEESDASVTINQLTMDDNGTYECSVSLLNDLDGVSKARVRLLVLVPPSKPDCSILGDTVIGSDIQLTCQSKEGSPLPQYRWQSFNFQNQERKGPPDHFSYVALYAGIAGGVVAALIIVGVLVYCCCCREKGEDEETRPNRSIYREPPEQLRELPRGREEDDSRRQSSDYAAHV
ncbi:Cell surface A33 antigen [Myotis davidii]|uniref:Cell surface A33 antigen n=1 Tax=Myotis davidii TaxID=225400 RepID=L5LWP5_MYODS|nr:Cell surface A33 antigen [Myotis davidii]